MVRDSWHSGDVDTVRTVFLNGRSLASHSVLGKPTTTVPLVELLAGRAAGADESHDEERARQAAARRSRTGPPPLPYEPMISDSAVQGQPPAAFSTVDSMAPVVLAAAAAAAGRSQAASPV